MKRFLLIVLLVLVAGCTQKTLEMGELDGGLDILTPDFKVVPLPEIASVRFQLTYAGGEQGYGHEVTSNVTVQNVSLPLDEAEACMVLERMASAYAANEDEGLPPLACDELERLESEVGIAWRAPLDWESIGVDRSGGGCWRDHILVNEDYLIVDVPMLCTEPHE